MPAPWGCCPPALLVGAWVQQLLNGNAQALVVALLALVPVTGASGALGLALATMLKLHPALGVLWYAGRREWRLLGWYAVGMLVLLLIQAPWLGAFVDFYVNDPVATETIPGMSLRVLGTVPWLLIAGAPRHRVGHVGPVALRVAAEHRPAAGRAAADPAGQPGAAAGGAASAP